MIPLATSGAGHALGRYELLLPVAQGGMAIVWAARLRGTRGFQKLVAIKTILPALSDDAQFEDMFLLEAQLASRIRHPNVGQILDLGDEDGTLFMVMEWIDGEALSALNRAARKQGGMPMGIATRIGLAAASGLHAAHELRGDDGQLVGLVHRDVSPQNILVTQDGVVKIVDFGVAKAAAAVDGRTKAGQLKGKVPFMSPEQALGRPVDRRADVFALGIILRQLLTGKHPFRADTENGTLIRICEAAPLPSLKTVMPACPDALCAAVDKALEKDPARRHPTMHAFASELERSLAALPPALREQDVGAFVHAVVGDRIASRRASIRAATAAAESRHVPLTSSGTFAAVVRSSSADLSGPVSVSSSGRFASGAPGSFTGAGMTGTDAFAREVRPRRGRTAMIFVLAALAGGVLAFGRGLTTWLHGEAPPIPAASPDTAAPAPPPVAEPPPIPTASSTAAASAPQAPTATATASAAAAPPVKPAAVPNRGSVRPTKGTGRSGQAESGPFQIRDPGF